MDVKHEHVLGLCSRIAEAVAVILSPDITRDLPKLGEDGCAIVLQVLADEKAARENRFVNTLNIDVYDESLVIAQQKAFVRAIDCALGANFNLASDNLDVIMKAGKERLIQVMKGEHHG